MSYGIPGSARSSAQGMLAPSNTPLRIYSVNFVLTGTATPASACLVLANASGTAATTASPATVYLTVFYDSTLPVGFGNWDSSEGLYFPNGVFVQTASAFGYYTISYVAEK